jgi:hypothetical protein
MLLDDGRALRLSTLRLRRLRRLARLAIMQIVLTATLMS